MFDDLAAYYHENAVSAFIDYREIRSSGTALDEAVTFAAR